MPTDPDATPYPLDHLAERGRDDASALVLSDRTLSYADLRSRVARRAGWLKAKVPEPGEEGELVHCGPLVAKGYWRDAVRTAERLRPAPPSSRYGGTAVWSGDRVRRDEEGLLYFVGRRDAMIKSAGNRISPQEIEEAALATGLVSEAIALGVPDERLGQAIHLIVRGNGDEEALRAALRRDLPNFMQPREVRWVERMPLNANGKVDRAALQAELAQ